MVENVISITDLRKFYLVGDFVVRALDGVDLTIKRGALLRTPWMRRSLPM